MAAAPPVTIGLPVRNGATFLPTALTSLCEQEFGDFRVLICDNASSDGTEDIARQFASVDPRLVYMRNAHDLGAPGNFNAVLNQARSEYFMWAAHDDVWEPPFLGSAVERLAQDGVSLAFSSFDSIDDQGIVTRTYPDIPRLQGPGQTVDRLRRFLELAEISGKANLVYGLTRTRALQRTGGMPPHTTWGGDMVLVFRLLCAGALSLDERVLFHKRETPYVDSWRGPLLSSPVRVVRQLQSMLRYHGSYLAALEDASLTAQERAQLAALVRSRRRALVLSTPPRLVRVASRRFGRRPQA